MIRPCLFNSCFQRQVIAIIDDEFVKTNQNNGMCRYPLNNQIWWSEDAEIGGWLWDLKTQKGSPLPDLPEPNGGKVHRMGFYHAIPADLCGDDREDLVLWDPTATDVFIYTPKPFDESAYRSYQAGPRQYNPRIMD